LENFDNIDKNTNNNFEDSIENSEQKEGEKLIETYLKEFASLPLDTLQPSQIQEYLRQLKEKIDSTSNRYIKTLLSKWNSTHS
jgi:AAA+ superfamily predicted ATPase